MRARLLITVLLLALPFGALNAQTPVVVQPAASDATAPTAQAVAENAALLQATVKLLEEVKAANEETLKKQAATLQLLDELEKAAEQIKVFSGRG